MMGTVRLSVGVSLLRAICVPPRGNRFALLIRRSVDRQSPRLRPFLFVFVLLASASLGACALLRANASLRGDLANADATVIAVAIVTFITDRIAPDDKSILLEPSIDDGGDRLATSLASQLEARGYRFERDAANSPDGHHLRILMPVYGGGYLLRIRLDDAEASTILSRSADGQLITGAPLSVQEAVR